MAELRQPQLCPDYNATYLFTILDLNHFWKPHLFQGAISILDSQKFYSMFYLHILIIENHLFGIFLNISLMFQNFQIFKTLRRDWEYPEAQAEFVFLLYCISGLWAQGWKLSLFFCKLIGSLIQYC